MQEGIKKSHNLFNEGYIQVSTIHKLWYAEYGNPHGVPVIILHGGPGAGCNTEFEFFDLNFWRIILLDQRGAKRSIPFGEMLDNTTQDLIQDIEILRQNLNINKWLIWGGSWGSALAIAYGQSYPDRALGFILRGIFLAEEEENLNIWYGMRSTYPEVWQKFNDFIPQNEQNDLIKAYYKLIMSSDAKISIAAARAFFEYDTICAFLSMTEDKLSLLMQDESIILGVARTFIYYSANNFFLQEGQLLNNIPKINHLPLIIINGRYDLITRPISAYKLHQAWPSSQLILVDAAGHSSREPAIAAQLMCSTEKMRRLIKF